MLLKLLILNMACEKPHWLRLQSKFTVGSVPVSYIFSDIIGNSCKPLEIFFLAFYTHVHAYPIQDLNDFRKTDGV